MWNTFELHFASGFCYRASAFCSWLAQWASEVLGGNSNYRTVINPAHQKFFFFRQVWMTLGQVHDTYSLPKWQAVKLTFFAPCMWCGSIIKLTSIRKFFVSLNFSGCDSRTQGLHPFLSQTPSNQRRDGGLDQNWQGDLFGANLFPRPLFQEPADGGAVCCTLKFQQKCQM